MRLPVIDTPSEDTVLLRFGDGIDAATNARVHAAMRHLQTHAPAWVIDWVPAYATLAIVLDGAAFGPQQLPAQAARAWLAGIDWAALEQAQMAACSRTVELPVCYGGEHGPDLEEVATHAGLTPEEVIARHCAGRYTVAMLGFAPGFPYLLGLDATLHMPRLATPRTRVPAGSVAIGGAQTGLYPRTSPGGWRLIGRTPLRVFDADAVPATRLQAGDAVRFVPIDAATYRRLEAHDA